MIINGVEYTPSTVKTEDYWYGSQLRFEITPTCAGEGLTHTLRFAVVRKEVVIAEKTAETTVLWVAPLELARHLVDQNGWAYDLLCDTYYGDTLIGTTTFSMYLRIPDDVGLTLQDGWAKVAVCNEGTHFSLLDALVQGYSAAKLVIDESLISDATAYGAKLYDITVKYNGEVVDESFRTEVLYGDSVSFECIVTDTRRRTQSRIITAPVYPYAKPVISEVNIYRCDSDGNPDESGTAVYVQADCSISLLGGVNDCVFQAQYRGISGDYGDWVEQKSGVGAVLWDGELSPRQTYEVWLQCVDTIGNTAQVTVIIPTDEAFFHGRSGGKGAAFGKYAEADNLLDVEWDLKTGGDLTVGGGITIGGKALWDYLMPVGYIYTSADPTSPAELFGGQWEQLKDVFLLAAGDTYAADSEGGAATVTLTEDQMPEHIHAIHSRTIYNNDGSSNGLCILLYGNETTHAGMYPAGGSQPHENMPPYVAKYMWQRVA